MRIVFVGASRLAVEAAKLLIRRGEEVVLIEADRAKIDAISDELDCGFLEGDAGKPDILKEASPKQTDILFYLTDDDHINIIGSLLARGMGFRRVVPTIQDTELEELCLKLGLEDVIVPAQTMGRYLADMVWQPRILELTTLMKGEARFFSFRVPDADAGKTVQQLDLPEQARVIAFYRDDEFFLAEADSELKKEDEVVILTHSRNLEKLEKRWPHERRAEAR